MNSIEYIVRLVTSLPDGTYIIEHPDGRLERKRNETDWARVDALTDEEIEAAMRDDPDWTDAMDIDWSKAELVYPPKKRPVSIRLDEDVVSFFKKMGPATRRASTPCCAAIWSRRRGGGKDVPCLAG